MDTDEFKIHVNIKAWWLLMIVHVLTAFQCVTVQLG